MRIQSYYRVILFRTRTQLGHAAEIVFHPPSPD